MKNRPTFADSSQKSEFDDFVPCGQDSNSAWQKKNKHLHPGWMISFDEPLKEKIHRSGMLAVHLVCRCRLWLDVFCACIISAPEHEAEPGRDHVFQKRY